MPTTRSATRKQTSIEDYTKDGQSTIRKSSSRGRRSSRSSHKVKEDEFHVDKSDKRKPTQKPESSTAPATKKPKQQHLSSSLDSVDKLEDPIVINRAPVLQLWGAVVAQFLHPKLPWPACLSIGNAISTLCAISKGRAIGTIEAKNEEKSDDHKGQEKQAQETADEVSVMGFPLHLKGNTVIMSGKPKSFSEDALRNKFGEEHYKATQKAMSDALQSWSSRKDDLDKKAFHMYEKFRPNVATGQKGWGRKGELNLHEVANAIKTP